MPRPLAHWWLVFALVLLAGRAAALEVREAVVCRDVADRAPVGVSTRFPLDVGELYAHLTVANLDGPAPIDVVWRFGEERVARSTLEVGRGVRWRTWAKLKVTPDREGHWSVAVIDAEGRRLAYVPFVIGAVGDAPPTPTPQRVVEEAAGEAVEAAPPPPPAGRTQSACRAQVSVRVDGNGRSTYYTGEVSFGDEQPHVRTVAGLVIHDGDARYVLDVRREVAEQAGAGGAVVRRWDQLVAVALPDGAPKVWYAYPATLAPPARPGADNKPQRFVEENVLDVESVLGPYVGLRATLAGFAGGAHGFDHSRYATVRAPGVLVDVPALVADDLKNLANLRATELRSRTLDHPPDAAKHDFRRAALVSTRAGLRVKTLMRCCSWAENRGLLDVDLPIEQVPAGLTAFVPGPEGWHLGPAACAAIRQGRDGVEARFGARDAEPLSIARRPGERLIGVRWLALGDAVPQAEIVGQALDRMRR